MIPELLVQKTMALSNWAIQLILANRQLWDVAKWISHLESLSSCKPQVRVFPYGGGQIARANKGQDNNTNRVIPGRRLQPMHNSNPEHTYIMMWKSTDSFPTLQKPWGDPKLVDK